MKKTAVTVTLPSRGTFYEDTLPTLFANGGNLSIYPMTAKEEKILAGAGNIPIELLMNSIFKNVIEENIDPMKLLSTDRFYILMQLRIHTWGGDYINRIMCESCGNHYDHEMDLSDPDQLPINYINDELEFPVECELPESQDIITLRLLTGEDEHAITRKVKRYNKTFKHAKGDISYIVRIASHITSINGEELEDNDMIQYVEELHVKDSAAIRDKIKLIEPGYDLTLYTECPHCYDENESQLRFTVKFFRP